MVGRSDDTSQSITITDNYFLTVTSDRMCATTDSIMVSNSCYLDIPNAFTPNGDGVNDYFFPRQFLSHQLVTFHMQLFSRWGEKVFETNSMDGQGWDGRLNGVLQPEGVFIYIIDAAFRNGTSEHRKGNVTLLR